MNELEHYYNSQSLQIEECKKWIKARFIEDVDIDTLPIDWALAWTQAVTEMGQEMTLKLIERMGKEGSL